MPLSREAIEVALDVLAQVTGPPVGMESRRSPRGGAHRVIGAARTGGLVTFDRYGRQVLNGQFAHGDWATQTLAVTRATRSRSASGCGISSMIPTIATTFAAI